jgi:hypothetical protein
MLKKFCALISVLVVFSGIGSATAAAATTTTTSSNTTSNTTTVAEAKLGLTSGQANAVRKAKSYLSVMAFSRSGLIDQLKYSGFSAKNAKFAVDYIRVSWKNQAYKKAKSYLKVMAFSLSGLIDQLEYSGFTHRQAVYGAKRAY